MTSFRPKFSVVIPAYNCGDTIAKCLDSLMEQVHSSYEVVVVDDGSTDETLNICESRPDVRVIRVKNGGPSKARNIGFKNALGEIVAFTDSDCVADPKWLKELERGFAVPEVAGVGGDQESPPDETDFGKRVQEIFKLLGIVTFYIHNSQEMGETAHNPSCNSAYRKKILEEIGGFDETLWPGEDVDLDIRIRRMGYRLVFNPAAVVRHYRPHTYGQFSKMMRRYGASAWHLFRRYGLFRTLHYEPILMVLGLMTLAVMMMWEPWTAAVLLTPFPVLWAWFFIKTGEFRKSIQWVILFTLIMLNWNWGFFTGYWYRPWGKQP